MLPLNTMRRLKASMLPRSQTHTMRTVASDSSLLSLRLKRMLLEPLKTSRSLTCGRSLSRDFAADGSVDPRPVADSQAGVAVDGPSRTAETTHTLSSDAPPDKVNSLLEPPVPVKHFINLSNGVEAIADMSRAGIPVSELAFCRIQSSHCEQNDFVNILNSLDANMLIYLALGFECRVYDFGSRGGIWSQTTADTGSGTSEHLYVPRAVWWGLEWQKYALNQLWDLPDRPAPLLHGHNVQKMFQKYFCQVPQRERKRIRFHKAFVTPSLRGVRLKGYFAPAHTDGLREQHAQLLASFFTESLRLERERGIPPSPEAFGMKAFNAQKYGHISRKGMASC